MASLDEKLKNLFNATETLAQFYDEIDSFMALLFSELKRVGFSTKGERLRPGTFAVKNLPRRLLATATAVYIKEDAGSDDAPEEEDELEEDDDESVSEKSAKKNVPIVPEMRIPFVFLSLFEPNTIPTHRNLEPPMLYHGALGEFRFVERKTGTPANPESPALALSNLANIRIKESNKPGHIIRIPAWRPKHMRKYALESKVIAIEKKGLLEYTSQEQIQALANKLNDFTSANGG